MTYSYGNFIEEIGKRKFEGKTRHYRRLLEVIEPYIEESKVKGFYPKNIFNGNGEKEFIFFLEQYIIIVTFQKSERYSLKSLPITKCEISLEIPEYNNKGVTFTLESKGEKLITLNSLEDSSNNWNETFIDNIKEIYKYLIER